MFELPRVIYCRVFVVGAAGGEDSEVVELVFELEVDAGFVHGRVCQHGLVDVAVCGEHVVAAVLGEEHFDGEWVVDACGFERDVGVYLLPAGSSTYRVAIAFMILIRVLLVKPEGIWGDV